MPCIFTSLLLTALAATLIDAAPTPTTNEDAGLAPRSYASGGMTCYCELRISSFGPFSLASLPRLVETLTFRILVRSDTCPRLPNAGLYSGVAQTGNNYGCL